MLSWRTSLSGITFSTVGGGAFWKVSEPTVVSLKIMDSPFVEPRARAHLFSITSTVILMYVYVQATVVICLPIQSNIDVADLAVAKILGTTQVLLVSSQIC